MATDLKIRWDFDFFDGDTIFENNDFTTDEGLGTAVLISWFTDQRADDSDDIPNADGDFIDKKGHWGDLVNPLSTGDQIGSKLWLLERSKTTQENLNKAVDYGKAALAWMKKDGIVSKIIVTAEKIKFESDYVLALKAELYKNDGTKVNISFDSEWFATN